MVTFKSVLAFILVAVFVGCFGMPPVGRPPDRSAREVSAATSGRQASAEASISAIEEEFLQACFNGKQSRVREITQAAEHRDIVKNRGHAALCLAAVRGQTETARVLVEAGVDVNGRTSRGGTALMWAAGSVESPEEMVGFLLEAGADANARAEEGRTALMDAALRGNESILRLLLRAGAKVDETTTEGSTALAEALSGGHAASAQILREAGAR